MLRVKWFLERKDCETAEIIPLSFAGDIERDSFNSRSQAGLVVSVAGVLNIAVLLQKRIFENRCLFPEEESGISVWR